MIHGNCDVELETEPAVYLSVDYVYDMGGLDWTILRGKLIFTDENGDESVEHLSASEATSHPFIRSLSDKIAREIYAQMEDT
jgi:hypothetical protein